MSESELASEIARAGPPPLGDVLRLEVVGGVVLGEVQYAADAALAPHRHEAASLYLVVRGGLTPSTARSAAGTTRLGAGAVTFDPEDHLHGARLHGRAPRGFGVGLPAAWAARYGAADALRRPAAAFGGRSSRVPHLMARLRYELGARDAARGLAVQGLALDLAAALAREGLAREGAAAARRGPLRVEAERAATLLHDWARTDGARTATAEPRGAEPAPPGPDGAGAVALAPTWAAVAAAVGAPPASLARAFRARWGCTPAAYVRGVRLDAAAGALAATACPVSHVALAAGFYDQAHFTRAFRAAYGVPPAAYRRALAGDRPAQDTAPRAAR